MRVELTPELEKMVREKVDAGLYSGPDEVIAEALQLLSRRDQGERRKLSRLRSAIATGEADIRAGRYTVIETREELEAFFADL